MMRYFKLLPVILLIFLIPFKLCCASATWTGSTNNGNWNDTLNWNPQTIPNGATDSATFPDEIPVEFSIVTFATDTTVNQIIITGSCSGFGLGGPVPTSRLTFAGTGIGAESTGFVINATNLPIEFFVDNNILLADSVNFRVQTLSPNNESPSSIDFQGAISGAPQSVTFTGPTSPNNFSAQLANSLTNTGAAPVPLTVGSNATLNLYGVNGPGSISINNFDVTIEEGGTITGTGSFSDTSSVTNHGTLSPTYQTNSPGNYGFSVIGSFTQSATGVLNLSIEQAIHHRETAASSLIENITPVISRLYNVTSVGDMSLSGTLNINVGTGYWQNNTSFIMAAATGPNSTLTTTNLQFNVTGTGVSQGDWNTPVIRNNSLVITCNKTIVSPPAFVSDMGANTRSLHQNIVLLGDTLSDNSQATRVLQNVYIDNPVLFEQYIVRLSHLAPKGLSSCRHYVAINNAAAINKKYYRASQRALNQDKSNRNGDYPTYAIPLSGVYVEPVSAFVHQQTRGNLGNNGQVGFTSATYGAMGGAVKVFDKQWVVEGALGYTHSNLVWRSFFGNARWDSIYAAPFIGWFNTRGFANFMIMGVMNFHTLYRRVFFPGVDLRAKARYKSYDMLLRLNGGIRQPMGRGYWFQPDFTFNWGTYFTNKYTETGAGALSLHVNRKTVFVIQPSIRSRFIKEYYTQKFCYAPCLYLGWLANIPLGSVSSRARFRDAPSNMLFNIQGFQKMTNQLVVGAEFYAQRFNKFIIKTYFEADLLSKLQVYTGRAKIEWVF